MLLEDFMKESGSTSATADASSNDGSASSLQSFLDKNPNLASASPQAIDNTEDPSLWQSTKDTASDLWNVAKNPSVIPAQMRVGFEKAIAGIQLRNRDSQLETGSIYYTDDELVKQKKDILEGLNATDALDKGIDETLQTKSYLGKMAKGVTQSIGMQLPTMPLMFVAPELAPLLTGTMYFSTYGDKYQERIREGYSPEQADKSANWHGATEVATEFIGLPFLTKFIKAAKAGAPITKAFAADMLGEQAGEFLANMAQTGEDVYTAGFKGLKGIDAVQQWVGSEEFKQSIIDTAVATAMQTGAMGSAMAPIQVSYRNRAVNQAATIDRAISEARALGQDNVIIANRSVPISELEQNRATLAESWEITPEEVGKASEAMSFKAGENPVQEEQRAIVDQAVQRASDYVDALSPQDQTEFLRSTETIQPNETMEVTQDEQGNQGTSQPDAGGNGISVDAQSEGGVQGNEEAQGQDVSQVQGNGQTLNQAEVSQIETPALSTPEVVQSVPVKAGSVEMFDHAMAGNEAGVTIESENFSEDQAHLFENLLTGLGFKTNTVLMTSEDMKSTPLGAYLTGLIKQKSDKLNPTQIAQGKFYNHVVDPKTGKTFHVAIVNSQITGNLWGTLVAMHEAIGHGVFYEFLQKAPQAVQDAVMADFMKFFDSVKNFHSLSQADQLRAAKMFAETGVSRGLKPTELISLLQGYIEKINPMGLNFDQLDQAQQMELQNILLKEWSANKIAQAVLTNKTGLSIIDRFWKSIADKIRSLYAKFKEQNLDMVTGVKSIEDYVEFLFSSAGKQSTFSKLGSGLDYIDTSSSKLGGTAKGGVENFNINSATPHRSLISTILDSLLQVDASGKVSINPAWLKDKMVDGKLVKRLRKMKGAYPSKEHGMTLEPIRSMHASESGYRVVKVNGNWQLQWTGKVDGVAKTDVLFELTKDKFPNFGGLGPSNSAFAVMQNIRDMILVVEMSKQKKIAEPAPVEGFLQTESGKAIKVKVPGIETKLIDLLQKAVLIAAEQGRPSAMVFAEIMNGTISLVDRKTAGVAGLVGTEEIASIEELQKLDRSVKILNRLGVTKEIVDGITGSTQIEESQTELQQTVALEAEAQAIEQLPSYKADSETKQIDTAVASLIEGKLAEKRRKSQGPLTKAELKEFILTRIEINGKDYTEVSKELRNYIESTAEIESARAMGEVAVEKSQSTIDYLEAVRATQSGVEFSYESMIEDELRVFHGTTNKIQDVPTMDKADPNGLYGPGIYTTQDQIDPDTGHLIVTAGYAEPSGNTLDFDGAYYLTNPNDGTPALVVPNDGGAFAIDPGNDEYRESLVWIPMNRDNSIAWGDIGSVEVLSNAQMREIMEAIKVGRIPAVMDNPNIMPLEIDPRIEETFNIDAEPNFSSNLVNYIKAAKLVEINRWAKSHYFGRMQEYLADKNRFMENAWAEFVKDSLKDNKDVYAQLTAMENGRANANKKLVELGYNFITHIGGNITGGVNHQVWIALKDGLVKSAFDNQHQRNQLPNVLFGEEKTDNGTHYYRDLKKSGKVVGQVEYVKKAKTWRISNIELDESVRGRGYAQGVYMKLAEMAKRDGKILKSDMKNGYMSHDAVRAWRALAKKGLAIEKQNYFVASLPSIVNVPNYGIEDEFAIDLMGSLVESEFAFKPSKRGKRSRIRKTGSYADILNENPKAKKVRKTKPVDPVKKAAKLEALKQFIDDMTVIKETAESLGYSLFEYLTKVEKYETKKARIAVSKFNSNTSLFSQTECILRLARHLGLVNEDGKEPLSLFIKELFKPITTTTVDDTGKISTEIEEGSDGSIESLGTAAKDILISRLQRLVVARDGQLYDFSKERTVSQLKQEKQENWDKQSPWKKALEFFKWVQTNGEEQLSTTKIGKELVFRLKRYMWKTTDYQRDYLFQLNEFAQEFKTEAQRQRLYEVWNSKVPATQREADFVRLIASINTVYSREMEVLGVKIESSNGKLTPHKHSDQASLDYFPHIWEKGAFEKKNEAMIQSLIDSGEAATKDQALKLMKKFEKNYIRSQKFANIERARETDLGGWMTDPIAVYQRYVTQTSKRLAQLREFGSTPELALAQFALGHFKDSKHPQALTIARDIINQATGVRTEELLATEANSALTSGIMYATGMLLQHAAFVQPGTLANMTMVGGFKNVAKSLVPGIKLYLNRRSPEYRQQWLEIVGSLAFTMNKELYDIVLDDKTRETTDKMLRTFGVTQIDSMMRIVGGLAGKLYAIEQASDYASKPTAKRADRLKRIGIDPIRLMDRENPGVLTDRELRTASLAFTEETNFVTNPLSTPAIIKNHPLGRAFFLFSRFAFQQHHLWKTVFKDSKGRALKGVMASLAVGTPMALLKMLLQGDDPEKVLEKDGYAKFLWKCFTTGAGPGLFFESIGNAMVMAFGGTPSGKTSGLAVDSPAFGIAETVAKGTKAAMKIGYQETFGDGDYTETDVNNLGKGSVAALQAALIKTNNLALNAAVGVTRPLAERKFYPSKRQAETSYLQ